MIPLYWSFAIFVAIVVLAYCAYVASFRTQPTSLNLETLKAEIARRERLHLPRAELRHKLVMGMAEKLNVEMGHE